MHFKLLQREKKYRGKIVDLTVDRLEYPSGNKTFREIIEHPGGAVVCCLFENRDILLIKQYRHPIAKEVIELPAGKLDPNENPLHCAQRELQEETGYEAKKWTKLTSILTTPGFCNEVLHIFLAQDVSLSEKGQALEEGEASIQLFRLPIVEAMAMIEREEIIDGKTIVGIMLGARKTGIL
ncbi:MAG: NUDIX hydrolase [Bacteroidota bacterium]|nr:NUDIX hydrolase [Bacteroidota bacterium]